MIDGDIEQVQDLESIEAVVKANIEKMGLDPVEYLPKRMEYYKKNFDNPKALKTFRIKTRSMGGRNNAHPCWGSRKRIGARCAPYIFKSKKYAWKISARLYMLI